MTNAAIETRSLRKRYGEKLAVEDLSLTVRRGEVFGFLGPNGAGKTTSLKMLLGLVEPTGGAGTLLGAPLGDRATRAKVGFLPEHFRFPEWTSARELLRFHGRLLELPDTIARERAERLLGTVDLLDAAHRPLRGYSKGMLQRTGLALALLGEPELVFLDEPTSGLDPLGRRLVRDLIRAERDKGTTVFLNSHLLGEVEATCDRVAFVKGGRVVRERALAAEGEGVEFEAVLRASGLDADARAGLERFGRVLHDEGDEVRLSLASESALPEIARWVVERGASLRHLSADHVSLEDEFLEVMGADHRPG
ncbi:MAG: ABC transporter ATP-binding protein [Candidatus Eisenbacteria bacterium]|uniref:ABC transporter ATP-binding protein n=1 Tax=Eiseniibacteriota bacterium TaxID=2212470 RepID=A0A933SE26_UNCEI|nr:ABC transporter ATP-binding protein [Candidatus Eisenbacteria bacterium]